MASLVYFSMTKPAPDFSTFFFFLELSLAITTAAAMVCFLNSSFKPYTRGKKSIVDFVSRRGAGQKKNIASSWRLRERLKAETSDGKNVSRTLLEYTCFGAFKNGLYFGLEAEMLTSSYPGLFLWS